MKRISLGELVEILDRYNQTNDFSRVISMGASYSNGIPYHVIWIETPNGSEKAIRIPYFEGGSDHRGR